MTEIICSAISAFSVILVAFISSKVKRQTKREDEINTLRARESKLSMDMMYACCVLSKGTAIALKNNHFNSEVDNGITLVNKATEKYNQFLRETVAENINF